MEASPPAPRLASVGHLLAPLPAPKKVANACESCARKKRKCDGARPVCGLCEKVKADCTWKLVPTQEHIDQLEELCSDLLSFITRLKDADPSTRDALLSNVSVVDGALRTSTKPTNGSAASASPTSGLRLSPAASDSALATPKERPRMATDGANKLSLHGPSSLFYLAEPSHASTLLPTLQADKVVLAEPDQRDFLEWFGVMTISGETEVSDQALHHLLRLHWVWVQPLFGFVYRPALLYDMQTASDPDSRFAPFLLLSLCAHVIRAVDLPLLEGENGVKLEQNSIITKARALVASEIDKGANESTIQGLVLLAARECSDGRSSQAGTYLGIAIGMIRDLGIHLDGGRTEVASEFSEMQLEVRRRVFWCAYLWDKISSLYYGRKPRLQLSNDTPELLFKDSSSETEPWIPWGIAPSATPFEPTPAYAISTFTSACKLAQVINSVLLYDAGEGDAASLTAIDADLAAFRDQLPAHMSLSIPVPHGVPSHIINVNCLHRMVTILVNHRMESSGATLPSASTSTLRAALEITELAKMSQSQYQDRQAVLSHSYCIYTAASAFLRALAARPAGAWPSQEEASWAEALQWCFTRLEGAAVSTVAIRQPLATLRLHLASVSAPPVHPLHNLLSSTLPLAAPILEYDPHNPQLESSIFADANFASLDAAMNFSGDWLDWQ